MAPQITLTKQSRLCAFLRRLVLSVLWVLVGQSVHAQSNYEPILETLEYRQQQQQMMAAPAGEDTPLDSPATPLQLVQAAEQLAPELSLIAERALEEQQPISLEEQIETQIVRTQLEQFGYDLFRTAPTTFAQVENLPVPADYLIGAGDSINVQLYGAQNVEYSLVVTRDGRLLLPELGPVEVSGMTFEELKSSISARYTDQAIGVNAVVSMSQLRTIQIRLTGDVAQPGAYTVSGLSTLVDALLSTGGVRYSGSLRNIQLKRGGQTISTLDLYALLLEGDVSSDLPLAHNDVIYVPPIGDVVYVGGEVQRPAIYELKSETSLDQVIELAGGLLPSASIEASHIERIIDRRFMTLIDLAAVNRFSSGEVPAIDVEAGDFVRILPVANTMDQVVLLSGHVKRPGGYQLLPAARLSSLLLNRDQILPNTDLDFALLVREQANTRRTFVEFVNLADALNFPGTSLDPALSPRDEVRLFSLQADRSASLAGLLAELDLQATDYRPAHTATVMGFARYTGRFPLQEGVRLLNFLRISGGIRQGVDMDYMVIAHTEFPSGKVVMTDYSLQAALLSPQSDAANPIIQPADRVYLFDDTINRSQLMQGDLALLREQANYTDNELLVRANGLFNHPGEYPLQPNMRASDLLCAAGGLTATAFGLHAELSRYEIVNGDRRYLEQILLNSEDLVGLCATQRVASQQTQADALADILEKYGRYQIVDDENRVTDLIDPVYFEFGQSDLNAEDLERLREAITYYHQQNLNVRLVLTGHTDSVPLSESSRARYGSNIGLSEARAGEVAEYIQSALNLDPQEIVIRGMGANQPVASNATPEGRALNRRTEIELLVDPPAGWGMPGNGVGGPSPGDVGRTGVADLAMDDARNPLLLPHDQLTFVKKPNWIEKAMVELDGEVMRPGLYVIDRGETLCEVMQRAGGITEDAYVFGAYFTRNSVLDMQQKTLDSIQAQLDDILIELSMSHSVNNDEKTPAGDSKDEYLQIIEQLDRATPNGRMVIDLDGILDCEEKAQVVLEDGDKLFVPTRPTWVNVAGQVYVPTSHMWRRNRDAEDYIELSGGGTVIGRVRDAYVIQANGEVTSYTGSRSSDRITQEEIQPGAEVIVPLNLDRMNTTERIQGWTRSLLEAALFAGILL